MNGLRVWKSRCKAAALMAAPVVWVSALRVKQQLLTEDICTRSFSLWLCTQTCTYITIKHRKQTLNKWTFAETSQSWLWWKNWWVNMKQWDKNWWLSRIKIRKCDCLIIQGNIYVRNHLRETLFLHFVTSASTPTLTHAVYLL